MFPIDGTVAQLAISTLGMTLLHFLWQGLLIGVAYLALIRLMRNAPSNVRYATGVLTLLIMFLTPIGTWLWLYKQASIQAMATATATQAIDTLMPVFVQTQMLAGSDSGITLAVVLPLVVAAWFAGVLLLAGRMFLDARHLRRLRREADTNVPYFLAAALEELGSRIGIAANRVSIGITDEVSTAMVTGWIRPFILMPTAILTCLPRDHIELILVHELAHIRRHDQLVNLFQVVVETTLFYHPMVRIVSNSVRNEREHATDDLVLDIREDRISYARALTRLEQYRGEALRLSVGSAGGDFTLRIQRLFHPRIRYQKGTIAAVMVLLLTLLSLLGANFAIWSLNGKEAGIESSSAAPIQQAPGPGPLSGIESELAVSGSGRDTRAPDAAAPDDVENAQEIEIGRAQGEAVSSSDRASGLVVDGEPDAESADRIPESRPTGDQFVTAADDTVASTNQVRLQEASSLTDAAPVEDAPNIAGIPDESDPPAVPDADEMTDAVAGVQEGIGAQPLEIAMIRQERSPVAESDPQPVYAGGALLSWHEPVYPKFAMRRGRESVVRLAFTIDTSGSVRDVEVLHADNANYGFGQAASEAVVNWRYEPFTVDGVPVERRVQQDVEFLLQDEFQLEGQCGPVTGTRFNYC